MRRLIASGVAATAALIGLALPADAAEPTQTISAVCDTGTVTIKDYPADSRVIVWTKPYRGNYTERYRTTFTGDLTVVVKVAGVYDRYQYTGSIKVEFWPGNVNGFTWGQTFTRC
jgi:hypothetical protein